MRPPLQIGCADRGIASGSGVLGVGQAAAAPSSCLLGRRPAKRGSYCRVVNAARLAVAAPWVVLLLLGTQSTTLQAYNSTGGVVLLAIGAAACLLAYRIMLRIGKLPQERRVLR